MFAVSVCAFAGPVENPGSRGIDWGQVRGKVAANGWARSVVEGMKEDTLAVMARYDSPPLGKTGWFHEYFCDDDARRLTFDPDKPTEHVCPGCGRVLPQWVGPCLEATPEVIRSGKTRIVALHHPDQLYGQPAKRVLVIVPLGSQSISGAAGFVMTAANPAQDAVRRERLELTNTLLGLYEMRLTTERRRLDLMRMRAALEIVSVVNDHQRFAGVGMALCNEVASRRRCDRVGLGFLKGRYVQLKALSHTEKFSRKMKLVQDIEAAMEECLDQDIEVTHPAATDANYARRRSAP